MSAVLAEVKDEAQASFSDISDLDASAYAEEGIEVPIINPRTRSPLGLKIKVLGVFSARFKELLRKARKRAEIAKTNMVAAAMEPQDDEDEISETLAEVTLGWTGMVENGKPVTFSRPEAVRIYRKYSIIRQQVFEAALNVSNFVKG